MSKKLTPILIIVVALAILISFGCKTREIVDNSVINKKILTDGTVEEITNKNIKTTIKGDWISTSTVATAGSIQAIKAESTGGSSTATALPNAFVGGGAVAMGSSPVEDSKPCAGFAQGTSLLGSLTSMSAVSKSWWYIGVPGETAAETAARVTALAKMNDAATANDSVSHWYDPAGWFSVNKDPKAELFKAARESVGDKIVDCTPVEIHDGDTLKVVCEDGFTRTIRLYGIDCPENSPKMHPALVQPFGQEATAKLQALVLNKTVQLEITGKDVHHNRLNGRIWLDGKDINLQLVKDGYAWAYPEYLKGEDKKTYITAQTAAKNAKLGLWAQDNPQSPWDYRSEKRKESAK